MSFFCEAPALLPKLGLQVFGPRVLLDGLVLLVGPGFLKIQDLLLVGGDPRAAPED